MAGNFVLEPIDDKFTISHRKNEEKLCIKRKTITENIKYWAETKPEEECVVFLKSDLDRESINWKNLYDSCLDFARGFVALGVKPGNVVAITLPPCRTWMFVALGAIFAGAVPIGVSFTYKDGSDVIALINRLQNCTTFVIDPKNEATSWEILQSLLSSDKNDQGTIISSMPSLKHVLCTSVPDKDSKVITLESFLGSEGQSENPLPDIKPTDIAVLFQTSGSTGIPKAVAHTHLSLTGMYLNLQTVYHHENERFYNDRPFNWVGGWPFNVVTGETRITVSGMTPTITNRAMFIMDAIRQEKCTSLLTTAPILLQIMEKEDALGDEWSLKTILTGGQPIRKRFEDTLVKMCVKFSIVYGGTEGGFVLANIVQKKGEFTEYSCGFPLYEVEIKVVDDAGTTVPVNTTGEIYYRTPYTFRDYYNDQTKTNTAKTEDGWYKSDDVGRMNENGYFFVEGRKSDVILSGALTVLPSIIETVLQECPGIKAVAIVPIPDDIFFQVLCACLIPESGSDVTEESVRRYCEEVHNDKRGLFTALPTYYLFFEKFPETSTGKISRKDIAMEAVRRVKQQE